jgi:hypothetical protein
MIDDRGWAVYYEWRVVIGPHTTLWSGGCRKH